ncbi:hypothetical protein B0J18DRAFT_437399 [Chaetomium sp. MPI-SDFR-AT-0129]|nr:hypothetical protein B0J18DRAFT_437399 [Chaetomium sp. MPI-SDFR-AT-0129]
MEYPVLPRPSLTFTVPSLHDGLPIDCRIYHPQSLDANPDSPPWQKHAAVIAHPYAPLGGCYDDPIVDIVAGTLLRLGFLVGTFNFRGAHGSAGRTSWTAKAERADYMSVVGFVAHYAHFLEPFRDGTPIVAENADIDGACHAADTAGQHITPVLLQGGYSYGSMITSQLPSLGSIVGLFNAPECGTPAAEIRLRAQHLAEMQNTVLASAREASVTHIGPRSPRKHVGLRVGGDESSRRTSHESPRSRSADFEETIRHGVAELMARTRKGHRRSRSGRIHPPQTPNGTEEAAPNHLLPVANFLAPSPAYLLVSPLQGIINNLASMSLPPLLSAPGKAWARFSLRGSDAAAESESPETDGAVPHITPTEAEDKLVHHTTLAIYGDRDGFVPVRKLREWASRLENVDGSKFRAHEVSSATHFWAPNNVALTLRNAVNTFGASLLGS